MALGQPPLASIVTLGVRDFGAQRDFYRRLGWPQASGSGDFAVFELRGALLALSPADKLASDARAEPGAGGGGIRFAIIISVDSPDEVDELADRVRRAGGTLTKEPVDAEFFTGRDAHFADPCFHEVFLAPPDEVEVAPPRQFQLLLAPPRWGQNILQLPWQTPLSSLPKTDPGGAGTSSPTILVGPEELRTLGPEQVRGITRSGSTF